MTGARELVVRLGGKWHGSYGTAACPAHDDLMPSLSITEREGRILWRCHAGCEQEAVLDALRRRGLLNGSDSVPEQPEPIKPQPPARDLSALLARTWRQAAIPHGTLVETYLHSRCVDIPPAGAAAIRFHPSLKHPTGQTWPVMLALITDAATGKPIGLHRTFLARDGSGKAPVTPAKMVLGAMRGCVVRLIADEDIETRIAYAEGIETALTAIKAGWKCWAVISAVNMAALPI